MTKNDQPTLISSKPIYKGRIFDVRLDTLREDGVEYQREIVAHHGSAVIVPLFEDGTIALVRQYRHAAEKYLWEIPAGSLEEGEDPLAGAARELEEEIGVTAARIEKLNEFYVSPGFLTEKMHLYLATGHTEVGQKLESDELIRVKRFTRSELDEMVRSGEIQDAKTLIGLSLAAGKSPR
jgi:ADP-ribose diphosphatase